MNPFTKMKLRIEKEPFSHSLQFFKKQLTKKFTVIYVSWIVFDVREVVKF